MPVLSLFIAIRYLMSRKRIRFVSLTAGIAFIGIAFGIFALIIVISVMNGLQADFETRLLRTTPSVRIQNKRHDVIKNEEQILSLIKNDKGIREIRRLYAAKALLTSGRFVSGALVLGEREEELRNQFKGFIEVGDIDLNPIDIGDETYYPLVLGTFLAERLHAVIGQKIYISSIAELVPNNDNLFPRQVSFILVGILKSGVPAYDAAAAFTSIEGLRFWLNEPTGAITDIDIDLKNVYDAPKYADYLRKSIKDKNIVVSNWIDENTHLFSSLKYEKVVTFIILGLIILIAAFNIISTILLFTQEKKVGIALLMVFGLPLNRIRRIFVFLGTLLGGMGVFLGSLFGIIGVILLKHYPLPIPGRLFPFKTVPVLFKTNDLLLVILAVFIFSVLAALIPSRGLRYIEPITVIYNR